MNCWEFNGYIREIMYIIYIKITHNTIVLIFFMYNVENGANLSLDNLKDELGNL